jgi:hypothetical protein
MKRIAFVAALIAAGVAAAMRAATNAIRFMRQSSFRSVNLLLPLSHS